MKPSWKLSKNASIFIRLQRGSIEKALHDGLKQGHEKGHVEGLAAGLKRGKHEMAINIASQLLDRLDDADIAISTGLSVAEIENLPQNSA